MRMSMKIACAVAVFALQACSEVGLFPTSGSDGSGAITIPRVILNCQSAHCRTNASAPLINVVITTSSCADPLFGGTVSSSTRSISCNGTTGCYGDITGWVSSGGPTTSIAAGTYNICACIDYTATGTPWVNCNTLGSMSNVTLSAGSGMKMMTTWVDQ